MSHLGQVPGAADAAAQALNQLIGGQPWDQLDELGKNQLRHMVTTVLTAYQHAIADEIKVKLAAKHLTQPGHAAEMSDFLARDAPR